MKGTKKAKEDLDEIVKAYLKENPSIKQALKIFNFSQNNYRDALKSLSASKVRVSSKTTQFDG